MFVSPINASKRSPVALFSSMDSAESAGKIVFLKGYGSINLVNTDGTEEIVLEESSTTTAPLWSPDGSRIVYQHEGFCVVNADGTGMVTISNLSQSDYSWSPDGMRILMAVDSDDNESSGVYLVNPDGSNLVRLTELRARGAIFSPDGEHIAFIARLDESAWPYHLYMMRSDGTDKAKLISDNISVSSYPSDWPFRNLAWAGDYIAFQNGASVYVTTTDGVSKFMLVGMGYWPAWSPDGTRIAFAKSARISQVYHVQFYTSDPDGTDAVLIADVEGYLNYQGPASWSPDGTKLVLSLAGNLHTVRADGSDLSQITQSGVDTYPQWSPLADGTTTTSTTTTTTTTSQTDGQPFPIIENLQFESFTLGIVVGAAVPILAIVVLLKRR